MNPLGKVSGLAPSQTAFSLFDEFKTFAFKGSVIDLAVGVIIGAAFGKIVDSLVKHILMPLIGALVPGDEGYRGLFVTLGRSKILYGEFIAEVVNFVIVALALFIFVVKFLGWVMRSKKQEATTPPAPTKDQELLMEIRDLLKTQATK